MSSDKIEIYKILEAIVESPLADKLTFTGGTCIHISYGSSRLSEDLDFDNPGIGRHDFGAFSQRIERKWAGYSCSRILFSKQFETALPDVKSLMG